MSQNPQTLQDAEHYLKSHYPNPSAAYEPDEDLVLRAILSVTEAISQGNQQTGAFSLFHIDGWKDVNGPNQDATNQNRTILRARQPLLLPWKNATGEILLVYVYSGDGQQAAGSAAPSIRLDFYSFPAKKFGKPEKNTIQTQVVQFLTNGGWFGAGPQPQLTAEWQRENVRGEAMTRRFTVILVAWALALHPLRLAPKFSNTLKKEDKNYVSAIILDVANGTAPPAALSALLVKLTIVSGNFDQNFNGGFAHTVDLRDNAFSTHWTKIQTAQNQNAPSNGQQQQPQQCTNCQVVDHCSGSRGTDLVCTNCPEHFLECAGGCQLCPIPSHCIPDVTNGALQGLSYHQSIHAFRPSLAPSKIKIKSQNNTVIDHRYVAVKCGERLYDHDTVLAITSVTEAISLNNRGKIFSLYSSQVYNNCTGAGENAFLSRPRGPQDVGNFSWEVVRQRRDLLFPVVQQADLFNDGGHICLAVVKHRNDNSKDDYDVEIFNSSPMSSVDDWTKNYVKKFVTEARWWSRDPLIQVPDGQWTVQPAAVQGDDWSSGFHTVLNAWSVALGLQLTCQPNLRRLDYAVETITRACYGAIDCKTICQLLRLLNWVTDDSVLARDRQFGLTRPLGAPEILNGWHKFMWEREASLATSAPLLKYSDYFADCHHCSCDSHCTDAIGIWLPYLPPTSFVGGAPPPPTATSSSDSISQFLHRMDRSGGRKALRSKTRVTDERYFRRMQKRFLGMEMLRSSTNRSTVRLLEGERRHLRRSKRSTI